MNNEHEEFNIIEAFDDKNIATNQIENKSDEKVAKKEIVVEFDSDDIDEYHKNMFSILSQILEDSIKEGKIGRLEAGLSEVEKRYYDGDTKSYDLNMKIQEARYILMCKYIESNDLEKAKDFCEKFDSEMQEYIKRKITVAVPNVIEFGNYYAAMTRVDISEGVNIDVNSLKFWEGIYNIEKPASNYRLPAQWQPSNGLILREGGIVGLPISSYNYFGFLKVFKIHYDPRSEKNNMNLMDVQRLREYLTRPKVTKNIRIVFEEGIEDVFLDFENVNMMCNFSVKLPSTARRIGGNLFRGSQNISYVDMGNSKIEVIDENTFLNSSIKKIKVPYTLRLIGNNAFANCKELKKVDFSNTELKRINRNAFYNSGVKKLRFPSELSTIDLEAFGECKNLKSVDLSTTKIKKIDSGFLANSGVSQVRLPQGIEVIDFCAFSDCKNLKEIDLSKTNIRKIGAYAFFNSNINNIKLPKTIEKIEYEAFAKCNKLKKMDLSKTKINQIASYAFYNSAIKDLKLPKGFNEMKDETIFEDCTFFKID